MLFVVVPFGILGCSMVQGLDIGRDQPFGDDALHDIPAGGRIEVPEAGYAIELPDDWQYIRPNVTQEVAMVDALADVDPELASDMEGFYASLAALGPQTPGSRSDTTARSSMSRDAASRSTGMSTGRSARSSCSVSVSGAGRS